MNNAVVTDIYRYPIKGLGGERLPSVTLYDGLGIACDRRWGLATRDWDELFSSGDKWRPWEYCLSMKKHERLALLSVSVREEQEDVPMLAVSVQGKEEVCAHPEDAQLEKFFRDFLNDDNLALRESPEPIWDERKMTISVLNLESVADLSAQLATDLSPLRFRANIHVKNLPPWAERESKTMLIDHAVKLLPEADIPRCAATRVNPQTAQQDVNVPEALVRYYGHNNMGVYAAVTNGGTISSGMEVLF